jgi:TonB family protein
MLGPALATAFASAIVAWGTVPPGPQRLDPPASIFGRDPALAPDSAVPPDAKVSGSLDKEIIRRIIRRHINEVKWCYEQELAHQPGLAGRIMVQYTIAATGQVVDSVLQSSTMANERLERCTVESVRRWQFPMPLGGGSVIVSYPFVFSPAAWVASVPTTKLLAGTNGAGAVEIEALDATRYVHRSTDAQSVSSNGLVVVTDGGLLLVDTAWTDAETEAILDWGERWFHRRWIGAVITHDHADRDGGLAALARRQLPVSALDLTVAKLARRGVRGVTTLFAARDGAMKDPRGFEAFYPGPGHAPDNIVLHFPGLVYGGCLVKAMVAADLGFTGDADVTAWPAAIRAVHARYKDLTIIPGHGPVDRSGEAYQHTLDLLAAASPKGGAAGATAKK